MNGLSVYGLDDRVAVVTDAQRGIGATVVFAEARLDPGGKRSSWLTLDVADSSSGINGHLLMVDADYSIT